MGRCGDEPSGIVIVQVGGSWLPWTHIRDISDQPAQFIAPRHWGPHAQVHLQTGEFIRIENRSAQQVAMEINRQIRQYSRPDTEVRPDPGTLR
jgi:hypothetical protein